MAHPNFGCGRKECAASTTGGLDKMGFWQFPCNLCEKAWEAGVAADEVTVMLPDDAKESS